MSRHAIAYLTGLLMAIGVGAVGYMLAQSMSPPEVRRDGLETVVDVSAMQPGELMEIQGLELPVWILRRTPDMLMALGTPMAPLDDPQSARSVQPAGMDSALRSARPEYLVLVPIFNLVNGRNGVLSTVSVNHLPADETPRLVAGAMHKWRGGFRDNAGKGIYFDYAGRAYGYANVWTGFASNITVPRHEFLTRNKLHVSVANLLNPPHAPNNRPGPGS